MASSVIKNRYRLKTYTYQYTVAGSSGITITATDLGMSTPSGYRPVAITRYATGNANVIPTVINVTATGSGGAMYLRNTSTSSITATVTLVILYVS